MPKKYLRTISFLATFAFIVLPARRVFSLPEGENVISGNATYDRSQPDTLNINQGTDKIIAEYNSFSIAKPEAVHFRQPSSSSIALNRVMGTDPSSLLGTLSANGKIFLINPNGILFGQGSRIDTAGLVASTLNISNTDFLSNRYAFIGQGGSVLNRGYISASGGYVSLLGSSVENTGVIEATLGSVALASGKALTLNFDPKGLISVVVDEATIENPENKDSAVINSGTIKAEGGKVLLTAKTLAGVFNKAVNNEGVIEANSLSNQNGVVELVANTPMSSSGNISAKAGSIKICTDGGLSLSGNYIADKINFDPPWINQLGPINLSGDTQFSSTGEIHVKYDINNSTGQLGFFADTSVTGTGDFIQDSGTTISGKEFIEIDAANVHINGGIIAVTPKELGSYAELDLYAHGGAESSGNILINNSSSLSATVTTGGEATVTLFSKQNIDITGIADLMATTQSGSAGIIGLAENSLNLNAQAGINANAQEGFGVVALLSLKGDLLGGGHISASGNGNGASLLETELNQLLKEKYQGAPSISFTLRNNCGSALLLSSQKGNVTLGDLSADLVAVAAGYDNYAPLSLSVTEEDGYGGSIFDSGDVDAHYLALLAKYSIGTQTAPIRTNVDVLGAYSFNSGNIYIDQSAKTIELGLYQPLIFTDSTGYPLSMALDFPIMAEFGLVHITSAADMIVNSVVAPHGGVYLDSTKGSIYAGHSLYGKKDWLDNIFGPIIPPGSISDVINALPVVLGVPRLGEGPHVFAGDYSYFSSLTGTIGVGSQENKDPLTSGGIEGIISPAVVAITGVKPSVDFDGYPDGYVLYYNTETEEGPLQVYPLLSGVDLTFENPLRVDIRVSQGSSLPAVRDGFTPKAALTLQFSSTLPPPPPENDDFSQFVDPLSPDLRAYYEILNVHRVSGVEPATPTNFFAYHPLTPTDSSAFDKIALDVSAYDFISDNIKLKKSLAPYFGTEGGPTK